MVAVAFTAQAQTKFHDVEVNEAQGAVKKITTNVMGQAQVVSFDQNGKQIEGLNDPKYDANGYLQSAKRTMFQGQETTINYKWENGKIVSQSMEMMGNQVVTKLTYNDKGAVASQSMDFGGQAMEMPYTDYKYDAKGNWISRKMSMMGQEMEQTRTIEYYK